MSTALNNNYSILPWYSSTDKQYGASLQRRGLYDGIGQWGILCPEQRLPCFQVIRTGSALEDPITTFNIISIETGNTIDLMGYINLSGLVVESFTDYDIISYPALTDMTDITIGEGQYYAVMSDGTNTWYSEIFRVEPKLSKHVKLQFWHDEPFIIQDYHISYASPYLSTVYLDTAINKPKYTWDDEIVDRDGYPFFVYGVSVKVFRMNVLLPEYMADALRILPHHHYKTFTYDGITYYVTYLKITQGDWIDQGHLCPFEFEFHTDTAVQTTGKVKPVSEGFSYDQAAYDDSFL